MGIVFRLVELLLMLVPLAAVVIAGINLWRRISADRADRADRTEPEPKNRPRPEARPAASTESPPNDDAARWRTLTRVVRRHRETDERWLAYELDPVALLGVPLMVDAADDRVSDLQRARLRADLLRPDRAEDMLDDRAAAGEYQHAVEHYVAAFDAVEAEAIRLGAGHLDGPARQRLDRARTLIGVAADPAAPSSERIRAQQEADRELDGVLVLPAATRALLARRAAGGRED